MKKGFFALPVLLIIVPIVMTGCGSANSTLPPTPVVPPDVYVAGALDNNSGIPVAMVWKNGVGTALTDGSREAVAGSVAISGGDVYVTGFQSNGVHTVAMLWKNGTPTALTDGTLNASAGRITVSGTDIYVVGGWGGYNAQNQYISVAGYWKNGVFVTLLNATNQGQIGTGEVTSLVVLGTDIYVSGLKYVLTNTGNNTAVFMPVAMYWKNGVPTTLTDGLTYATATSMAVDGSDVYVVGSHCLNLSPNCTYAAIWKNGMETILSPVLNSAAYGIALSGANVYVAGDLTVNSQNQPESWANGNPTVLTSLPSSGANDVITNGNDVYVVGQVNGNACYWKNGSVHSVATGISPSTGDGIAVVQPQ